MMSIYQEARAILFRAMVGEAPIPTAESVAQAKVDLRGDPEFHAALDELVSIILITQRDMGKEDGAQEAWHARLQAYIAAQLDGQAYTSEFADVRRALDASVALSEEYALLYTTMEREWHGTLPVPLAIPPLNFAMTDLPAFDSPVLEAPAPENALPEPGFRDAIPVVQKIAPSPLLGSRWFTYTKLAWEMLLEQLSFLKFGAVIQPGLVFVFTLVLVTGLWLASHPFGVNSITTGAYPIETIKRQDSFLKTQMSLETPLPTAVNTLHWGPIDEDYLGCRFLRPVAFARSICKL
ncbi:MAG: hypothetical protein NT075_05145 [Chloroflexi bacterium]|nr:hypothetical protein [Chloroflexota bacterium]